MTTKNDKSGRIILVIVGLLVLAALGYFAMKYTGAKKLNEEKDGQIISLKHDVKKLETDLETLGKTLNDTQVDLREKDKLLAQRDGELAKLEYRLRTYKKNSGANKELIQKLEAQIGGMRKNVTNFEHKVSVLEGTISLQSDSLASQGEENREQQAQIQGLDSAIRDKDQRLRKAAALHAASFTFYNVNAKGKEKQDVSFRRSAMKNLKICFQLLPNTEAKAGPRTIYMVYENPDNSKNINKEAGFSDRFMLNGQSRMYTAKLTLNYNRQKQEVCIPYTRPKGDKYQKGDQYVNIYSEGMLIGQGKFVIK